MSESKAARLLPWSGLLFTAVFVVAVFVLSGNTPGEKASPEKVMAYYNSHHDRTIAGDFLAPLGVLAFILFFSYLRSLARERGNTGVGPTVMVAGAIIFGSALLASCSIDLTLVSSSDHNQAQVAQTMNVLSNNTWLPFIAGYALAMFGVGLTILKSRFLPAWLGWLALVVGIVSLVGPGGFVAFFFVPAFVLVVSVWLGLRKSDAPAASAPTPTA